MVAVAFDADPSIELGALSLSKGSGRWGVAEWVNPDEFPAISLQPLNAEYK